MFVIYVGSRSRLDWSNVILITSYNNSSIVQSCDISGPLGPVLLERPVTGWWQILFTGRNVVILPWCRVWSAGRETPGQSIDQRLDWWEWWASESCWAADHGSHNTTLWTEGSVSHQSFSSYQERGGSPSVSNYTSVSAAGQGRDQSLSIPLKVSHGDIFLNHLKILKFIVGESVSLPATIQWVSVTGHWTGPRCHQWSSQRPTQHERSYSHLCYDNLNITSLAITAIISQSRLSANTFFFWGDANKRNFPVLSTEKTLITIMSETLKTIFSEWFLTGPGFPSLHYHFL